MSLPRKFHGHISFFAEIYSLEHAELKKHFVTNCFNHGEITFYANEIRHHELAIFAFVHMTKVTWTQGYGVSWTEHSCVRHSCVTILCIPNVRFL